MNVKNPYRFKKTDLWNPISGGVYDTVSLDLNPPEATPWNLVFSEDGTKLYVTGNTGDKCRQYSGTAWDLSTFTDDSKEFAFTTQTSQPFNIRWSLDGTKCYAVGRNNHTVWQYNASTSWDISTLSYASKSLVLNNISNTFTDMFFSPDGLILLTLTQATQSMDYYDLSVAWDVSTGVYDSFKSSSFSFDPQSEGLFFNPNGLQMYIVESGDDKIFEFRITTPFDLSEITAEYTSKDVTAQEGQPRGVAFKQDGTKFYVCGSATDFAYQYSL